MSLRFPLAATAVFCALSTGCPLFDLQVESAEVCVAVRDITFERPADLPPDSGPISFEQTIVIDEQVQSIRDTISELELDASMSLVSVLASLTATDGTPAPVGSLQALEIVAYSPADGSLPAVSLVQCEDCSFASSDVTFQVADRDLMPYINSGSVNLDVAITGEPPESSLTMALDLCFATSARYRKEL